MKEHKNFYGTIIAFLLTIVLVLAGNSTLSAEVLFGDDFEQDNFDEKWTTFSNWKVKGKGGNRFAEKLDEAGQVDLEIKDFVLKAPFSLQMRLNQVGADAGAHVAVYTLRNPFMGYIYGFNNGGAVEFNDIGGKRGRVVFAWKVGADTWVTYKIQAEIGAIGFIKSAKCYYQIEGEKDFTLSHEIKDVGIEHKEVFIGLWVGSTVRVDDVYVWEGVNKSLEEALTVFSHRKLSTFWGTIKNREDRKY